MANIEDFIEESDTKTSMASKIGSKFSDVLKNFESDPSKVYDKCKKFVESIDLSNYPSEMHEALQTFKESLVFDAEFLEGFDKETLKHVSAYVDTLQTLISKEASFSGEKSPINKEYADIQKALREFSQITKKYEGALSARALAKNASKEEQVKSLNISGSDREMAELTSAFKYMGMDILPDGNGSYTCIEIQNTGVPYIDASGKTQYLRISKEATQSFIDGYLKNGKLSFEKEESELAEQIDRLKAMRENQKEGGFYAPSNDEIARQEREVEKARKSLEIKKSKKITPKGLFGYFVEKELVSKIPRSSRNKELVRSAQEKFSVDSPEFQTFVIMDNPDIIKNDMALCALHQIKKGNMEVMSELVDQLDFSDSMTSDFANGFRNSGRLEDMLDDVAHIKDETQTSAEQNEQNINNIVAKYNTLAFRLETLAESYKGSRKEAELKAQAENFRNIAGSVQVFASAVYEIDSARLSGEIENLPEEIGSEEALVSAIMSAVSIENGKLSVTKDLTDSNGNVWLAKTALEGYIQSNAPVNDGKESSQASTKDGTVPEVLSYMLDYEVAENVTLETVLTREAMYDMSIALIDDGNNIISNIYRDFVVSGVSAKEYVEKLAENGTDFSEGFAGAIDTDVLISTFDYCKLRDIEVAKDPNKEVSMEEHCVGYDRDKSNASMCYAIADRVALSLAKDKPLRGKFESASKEERKKIIKELSARKEVLDGPFTEKEIETSRERWSSLFKFATSERAGIGFDQMKDENAKKLAEALDKYGNTLLGKYDQDNKKLVESGEKIVDAEINNKQAQNGSTIVNDAPESGENGEATQEGDNLIEYGKVFPRATPATKIGKDLQPYNIKVGKKFLDQVIQAFQKVQIQNPWAKSNKDFVGEPDARDNDKKDNTKKQTTTDENSNQTGNDGQTAENNKTSEVKQNDEQNQVGVFANYPEDTIRARVAMVSVGMGINSMIDESSRDENGNINLNENAKIAKQAVEYMTLTGGSDPKVEMNIGGDKISLSLADAMQQVFLREFASGDKGATEIKTSIDGIVGQLKDDNLIKMVNSMIPTGGSDAKTDASMWGVIPAQVVSMIRMTSKDQAPQPGEPMSVELGSELTLEQLEEFKKAKSFAELKAMVGKSNIYKQEKINPIYVLGKELKSPKDFKIGPIQLDESEPTMQ